MYSHKEEYRKDDAVVLGGSESRCLYYVEKGSVEVCNTADDTKITVALIGEGDFFGEIGFFDGKTRVRDIRATEDSVIRLFNPVTVSRMQREDPGGYGRFMTVMAQSICAKFRRVLDEREPLTAYAASLSTGGRIFEESKPIPERILKIPEWHMINGFVEDFKAFFFNISHQLQQDAREEIPEDLRVQCSSMMDDFNGRLQDAQERIAASDASEYLWGYLFKEIFPYFMRSRFAERAYYKPRGYAGDFMMMEMIYRNQPDGDGKLGRLMDAWCLETAPARAVRSRRRLLHGLIRSLAEEKAERESIIGIMNLACGSNRELFDFLAECQYTQRIEAICIDADRKALEYTNQHVNIIPHAASIRLMNDNVVKWSLGRIRHHFSRQDIIYSSGLTDYLDDRLFLALIARCHEYLKPGGTLIVGNFGMENANRVFIDHILQWKLIYRSEEDLKGLFARSPFGGDVRVIEEENRVNLFVIATKNL
ncbi:MAG: cyclic nucleotide-binding domain-containing protein [Syntrophobacteraceae bacterium]|nr:cyclic nucleotide-binding domain-containing protein [Syntrophobacteraceae bacterium]